MKKVRDLTFDLDSELGAVGRQVEMLADIKIELNELITEMDDQEYIGRGGTYYKQFHRKVRILGELMNYVIQTLEENYKKTQEVHSEMFDEIKAEEKNLIAKSKKA